MMSTVAKSSATMTGLWKGSTTTAVPILMRSVMAEAYAAMVWMDEVIE